MTGIPRLALTPGEPAGIGPDLCVQLVQESLPCELVAVADPQLLSERAALLDLPLRICEFEPDAPVEAHLPGSIKVLPVKLAKPVQVGQLDPANAPYVLATLDAATDACMQGVFSGLITGPVHKGVINEAGVAFTGHTEYLAQRSGGQPVMMLATEGLRVALATTHVPLSQVSSAISKASLSQVLEILYRDLQHKFGLATPRILVCGLNPHAGEDGHLGHEEIETITPVLEEFRAKGWQLEGPLPADTLFTPGNLARADAVLAMYHDQGLPVLKHMGFGQAVNITLGLPMVRTSVDHGTALELAGSGRAKIDSLQYALKVALDVTANKK